MLPRISTRSGDKRFDWVVAAPAELAGTVLVWQALSPKQIKSKKLSRQAVCFSFPSSYLYKS